MAFKVFLDANVLLDYTLKRESYQISKQLFELVEGQQIQLFTSPSVLHILAYWLAKAFGKKSAKELLILLLENLKIIDADHYVALTAVHSTSDDIEDALQYFTAIHHKLDFLLTRDKAFLRQSQPVLPIITPEHFLSEIQK